MDKILFHYGVKGMKWGVHKNNIKLSNFKMLTKKVDLSGTPGIKYKWVDNQNKPVAKFTTFEWWDGKNIEDLKVYDDYKKNGLSYQLLDYAVNKLNCKALTVDKDNEIAKHVYDNYGFKVVDQDENRYYMQFDKKLSHYGTPRHSGRYPWGSGEDPQQRNKSFLGYVDDLKNKGMSEVDIAKGLGISTTQLRAKKSILKAEQRKADVAEAIRLKTKGYSNVEIGKRIGINESSVRALLNPAIQERSEITETISKMLKETVDKKEFVDVGVGVERYIGISRTKLKTAIAQLEEEGGYKLHKFDVEQVGTGKKTNMMVLTKDDVDYRTMLKNKDKIQLIQSYSIDGGRTMLGLEPPKSIDSKRVLIRYGDEGGKFKDGVIELRRGVEDLSLGNSKYAQVRIAVDGSHYMKGMAMYSDDMPKGVDIIYNTNKDAGTSKEKVFKEMKKNKETNEIDQDNPFGATIKAGGQRHYIDKNGKDQLSVINIVNEEGDWGDWSKSLSSQMMSKQRPALAKKQLDLAFDIKKEEYDDIMSLTNPVIKKKLLESFADDCDSSAVHLKAAALPRQGSHVILPFPTMKENEIYAPNYRNGEKVVLIRYPHGGIFEIPELTVNNKHKEANKIIPQARDAVGINHKVAERLSGADFDGDTVLVIPNNNGLIKSSSPLKGLIDFDPKISYKGYEGMPVISAKAKQMKMGEVSNLITDMTIKGAPFDEIARAVRHSMVVIDAEKHKLNYKQSYIDNGIADLKKKYQGGERSGAATLISKASSEKRIDYREEGKKVFYPETGETKRLYIDPKTGKKLYEYTGETFTNRQGRLIRRTIKSTKMAEEDNALNLSSGTPMETVYGQYANKLKSLANTARKQTIDIKYIPYSPTAKKTYAKEVETLMANLNIALKNAPLERQAQLLANSIVSAKKASNPNMENDELKKIKGQALAEARSRTGAKKQRIDITDRQWEAIQAGAVSTNTLNQILNNTDLDKVKTLATPRTKVGMTKAKTTKARSMLESGYTQSEVADALGVSVNTIASLI